MTSIEWFVEQLEERGHIIPDHLEETAIKMHKQDIMDAFDNGVEDDGYIDNAEQYYQETFKGGELETFKQETLYTEEDLIDAIGMARNEPDMTWKDIIQSLKQPKKD